MNPGFGCLYTSGVVEIDIITSCSYNCFFCRKVNAKKNVVSLDDAYRAIDHIDQLGVRKIVISGGDPLLHPNIQKICAYARKKDFIIGLATNGSQINSRTLKLIGDDVDWMILPSDSACESTEQRLGRGDGHHLTHLMQIREAIRDEDIGIHLYSMVTPLNVNESLWPLSDMIEPDLWTLVLHYNGYTTDKTGNRQHLNEKEIKEFTTRHHGLRLSNGLRPWIVYSDELAYTCINSDSIPGTERNCIIK